MDGFNNTKTEVPEIVIKFFAERRSNVKIGILALQGNFEQHQTMLRLLGFSTAYIRSVDHMKGIDGLVLPGGESTTLAKLLDSNQLRKPIVEFGMSKPILGTCAGLILLSKTVKGPSFKSLGLVDATVMRNAYGRQIHSKLDKIDLSSANQCKEASNEQVMFIRAPAILSVGDGVKVLATHNRLPCAIRQKKLVGLTFHPEATNLTLFHEMAFDGLCDQQITL